MGVPGLFPFIRQTWPKIIRHFRKGDYTRKVDYLYLDANGLLHQAAQTVYNYGSYKTMLSEYQHMSHEEREKEVFHLFFQYVVDVVSIIIPKKVLYIAIDGPAPQAKQNQQRQRRFVAAQSREDNSFDSCCISPGTLFMNRMTEYLNFAIRKELNTHWRDIEVIFSPPTVPAEGEHKILDYIRNLDEKEKKCEHCLFGPDGDLIMLTLSIHIPSMFLFRQDLESPEYYHLLNMGMLRKELPWYMKSSHNRLNDSIDDFVFIGFFVGNDFLPRIQMFQYLDQGLNKMITEYSHLSRRKNYLIKNGEVDLNGFHQFVSLLADNEEYYLGRQASCSVSHEKFRDRTLLKNIISDKLNFQGYRRDYYQKMNIQVSDKESKKQIEKLCHDYVKTLIWVYKYYVHGLPSWRWAYEYHYAPLMVDLKWYLSLVLIKNTSFDFELGEPSPPFVQLLSVLPPTSASLLPRAYRKLMLSPDSQLVQLGYYPKKFRIDYEGKRRDYQGVVLLPFVSYQEVLSCYQKMIPHVKTDYIRNKRGMVSTMKYDPDYQVEYISKSGIIPRLRVRTTKSV